MMKIDRNIRNTRTKEESRKAHTQAIISAACLIVLWIVLMNIQSAILKGVSGFSRLLAMVLSLAVGIALVAGVMIALYRFAKARN